MKSIFSCAALFLSLSLYGQPAMSEAEKALRKEDAIKDLLQYTKDTPRKNTLAKSNENVIFSFTTTNNKIVSCCIAKHSSPTAGYIVYRFGTTDKIEFEFPKDTLNSFSQFSYAGYHRGGGIQNACMDIDILRFENNGYRYEISDTYTCEENKKDIGIDIYKPGSDKPIIIRAKGKIIGSIYNLKDVVNRSDEL